MTGMLHDRPEYLPAPPIKLGEASDFDPRNEREAYQDAVEQLQALYPQFPGGSTRRVFDAGAVVYKVGDAETNECEAEHYASGDSHVPIAPCRIVYTHMGVSILIMQTVNPLRDYDQLPEWAHLIDSKQVGFTPYGEVVAFDIGSGPGMRADSQENLEADRPDIERFMQDEHATPRRFYASA